MRKAIISMCLHGLQIDQVARLTGASQRTISRVMLERRQTGDQVAEARRAPPPEHVARRLDFVDDAEGFRLAGRHEAVALEGGLDLGRRPAAVA